MLLTMLEVRGKMEAVCRVRININNATPLIALSLDKVPVKVVKMMVEDDGAMGTSSPSSVRVLPRILVSLRKGIRKEIMATSRVLEIMPNLDTIPTTLVLWWLSRSWRISWKINLMSQPLWIYQ
jgi:hypothetical protein